MRPDTPALESPARVTRAYVNGARHRLFEGFAPGMRMHDNGQDFTPRVSGV
jgi:hypothetical protein